MKKCFTQILYQPYHLAIKKGTITIPIRNSVYDGVRVPERLMDYGITAVVQKVCSFYTNETSQNRNKI